MKKIREIIRLEEQAGLSHRQIAQATGVSRPIVSQTIGNARVRGLMFKDAEQMSDTELRELLRKPEKTMKRADILSENFPSYAKELKKTGVTLQLLWDEYRKEYSEGLSYTQFCFHYQKWREEARISMHNEHKPGDKMFIDYTGKKMEIISAETGEKTPCEIFIAILPCSQYTYVEATLNQNQESFMRSTENSLRYFGGAVSAIVPDNLKSGVIKADLYEPDLNPLFADFAEYYRCAVLPARARKPKDKAHVENAVKIIYTRVFAPLRHTLFHTIEELNKAIREQLEEHNNQLFQKMDISRKALFKEVESSHLKPLPIYRYPLKHFQNNARVGFNYHVELKDDKHYYSVPYLLRGKKVNFIYDERNVAIYHDYIRIYQHRRDRRNYRYTTIKEHMPPQHRFRDNWNPEKLKWWASNVGEDTLRAVTLILEAKPYPEQAYKSILGVLNLATKHGHKALNLACRKACNMERVNYHFIKEQTKYIRDQYEKDIDSKQLSLLPSDHENIRGNEYYK
ncbi:MAG: IS21 family transposase [Spirochaetaceae bacterium]|nr:IS21 family transposase [Spirochaetaceae bacterium]